MERMNDANKVDHLRDEVRELSHQLEKMSLRAQQAEAMHRTTIHHCMW